MDCRLCNLQHNDHKSRDIQWSGSNPINTDYVWYNLVAVAIAMCECCCDEWSVSTVRYFEINLFFLLLLLVSKFE